MLLTKAMGLASFMAIGCAHAAVTQEKATVAEVMAKVQQAALALQTNKEAALAEFLNPDGSWNPNNKWVWKDTYVFVYDCKADKALAHPLLMGGTLMDIKDKNGKFVVKELCKAGERKTGG